MATIIAGIYLFVRVHLKSGFSFTERCRNLCVCFFFGCGQIERFCVVVWGGSFIAVSFWSYFSRRWLSGVYFFSRLSWFLVSGTLFIASIKICSMKFESEWMPEIFYVLCVNFFEWRVIFYIFASKFLTALLISMKLCSSICNVKMASFVLLVRWYKPPYKFSLKISL